MNKRPLLLGLVCFALGDLGGFLRGQWIWIAIATGGLFLLFSYVWKNGVRAILLLFVFLFMIGGISGYDATRPRVLDSVDAVMLSQVKVEGTIVKIKKNTSGMEVYLNNVLYDTGKYKGNLKNKLVVQLKKMPGKLGQRLLCSGAFQKLEHARNPGGFDAFQYYRGQNVDYRMEGKKIIKIYGKPYFIRESLRQVQRKCIQNYIKLLNKKDAGVLEAIVLGEKSDLDPEIKQAYQSAGIAHVIAISGLHLGLVGVALFNGLRKITVPYLPSAIVAGTTLVLYGLLTGMSGSLKRALMMLLISFIGQVIGRAYDLLSAMSLAALLLLIGSPLQLFDAGFLLSFGAILGIGVVFAVMKEKIDSFQKEKQERLLIYKTKKQTKLQRGKRYVLDSFLVSCCIQIITAPIIAWYYFEFPMYAIFLNLIVIPLMSLLVPCAMLGLIVSFVQIKLGGILLQPSVLILHFYEKICYIVNSFPFAHWIVGRPAIWQILFYYTMVGFVLLSIYKWEIIKHKVLAIYQLVRNKNGNKKQSNDKVKYGLVVGSIVFLLSISIGLAELGVWFKTTQDKTWEITMLDVGQGDGFVIRTPNQHVILIDGGSSSQKKLYEYTYEPYLKSQGITAIDYAIISHADLDHISGIEALLQHGYPVRYLVMPDISNIDENYQRLYLLAQKRKITVVKISRGQRMEDGGITLECMHPPKGYRTEDANYYSTTLGLKYQNFSMLFTGDLGGEAELEVAEYMKQQRDTNYTILKVGHHGSKTSTSKTFLDQVNPRIGLISVGEKNRYGHPNSDVIERLNAIGAKIYRTDESGAVQIIYSKNGIKIKY